MRHCRLALPFVTAAAPLTLALFSPPAAARAQMTRTTPTTTARARAAAPTLAPATYNGRAAFRLSDGKTEAVVVPELSGRVLRYGFVGGPNRLWNAPAGKTFNETEWKNWGGDKTWPAPQSAWPVYLPQGAWPPPPSYDSLPHPAEALPAQAASAAGGATRFLLRTTGPVMVGWGVRCVRDYGFDTATGEFVIRATFRKEPAGTGAASEARQIAAWNVTQIVPPDAAFAPLNPQSTYKNNFHWFGGARPREARTEAVSPALLRFVPTTGFYKLGADVTNGAVVAVKDGVALRLQATRVAGATYPEGADGNGFPLTIWNQGETDAPARYVELELMSPLTIMRAGDSLSHTVRWSLHRLPGRDVNDARVRAAVEDLLRPAAAPTASVSRP